MSSGDLNAELSKKTSFFGLKLWVIIGICVGVFIVGILCLLSVWVTFQRKSRRKLDKYSHYQIPNVSKDIKIDRVAVNDQPESLFLTIHDKSSEKNSEKLIAHLDRSKSSDGDNISQCSSIYHHERGFSSQSGEEGSSGTVRKQSSSYGLPMASPLIGLPEFSHLGWGHWFTLRDLELATNRFSAENVIGEGGYGVVYKGRLINGTEVAVKKLLNNLMLVYEYVNNGNLEQWLHGGMRQHGTLTWEARMKILLGTAKAYVAPEYANTGLLNEKSDIYSFGVLLLEAITGRDPVDYGRPANEVNLVEWLKMMVGYRRAEEVVDPNLEAKPSTRSLKRALLVALRCVDPDSEKRPKMSQVVRMLEADEFPYREDRRNRKSRTASMEIDSIKDGCCSTDVESRAGQSDSIHG
nr:probable receptor-like protein kinase At2g42960 [Ipomoea batatas]GMD33346.1 probable receptor-like protein kinase At2g42960 [Ipomoea batatas]